MLKKILSLILFFFVGEIFAEVYRGTDYRKLPNNVSVIFLETNWSDNVFVTACLSTGKSDDIYKSGKAELVGNIFKRKLEKEMNKSPQRFNVEMISFVGPEQTLFSFYGKQVDLPFHIKCLAQHFYNLEISEEELTREKELITNRFNQSMIPDKNKLRSKSLQSLYWHNALGKPFSVDELKTISLGELKKFREENYTNNRLTLIISGYVKNKDEIVKVIEEKFSNTKKSEIKRLREPIHHDATVSFDMVSSQVKLPYVEIYWRLPNYREEKSVYDNDEYFRKVSPMALEIFLIYLKTELEKSLIHELKIASSVDFDYSFWNYSEGNLRISVLLKEKQYSKGVETEILSEIKKLAYEVNENKLVTARKALYKSANVFNYLTDVIDTMNWLSDKIGVGYDYEYLKKYQEVINNFKLETIKEEVVKFFKKEPDVVSVLNPKERE